MKNFQLFALITVGIILSAVCSILFKQPRELFLSLILTSSFLWALFLFLNSRSLPLNRFLKILFLLPSVLSIVLIFKQPDDTPTILAVRKLSRLELPWILSTFMIPVIGWVISPSILPFSFAGVLLVLMSCIKQNGPTCY